MLVACGIDLQKLWVHNRGLVNSLVWYITSVVAAVVAAAPCGGCWSGLWCVDGCIDTRGYLAFMILFSRTLQTDKLLKHGQSRCMKKLARHNVNSDWLVRVSVLQ